MEPVFPTSEAWRRVGNAVRIVEGGRNFINQREEDPYLFPAVVFKVTGAASGGYYPGVLLAWDSDTEAWVELEECYILA